MTIQTNDLIAIEIKSLDEYDLAVAMRPDLAEIKFEDLKGHFFGLSDGELQFATFPPGFLTEQTVIYKGEFKNLNIMRIDMK